MLSISSFFCVIHFLLNFRVGVASFITLLVQKVMIDIKPFTTMLLKLLFSAVLEEKSYAAKKAFASSCATVLKYASLSQAQKLIEDTASLHSGGKNDQLSGAILIKSYLSNAADVLSGYNTVVIPVIFSSRYVKGILSLHFLDFLNILDIYDALKSVSSNTKAFAFV